MTTVIVGAGIIGLSTAYYLSEDSDIAPSDIHLVEFSPELFASASGLAGGYLERGQFGRDLASLGDLSFALHEQLALNHDGATKWGYTTTTRMALDASSEHMEDKSVQEAVGSVAAEGITSTGPQWLKRSYHKGLTLDADGDAAQIDPKRLCEFLLSTCQSRGVHLYQPAKVGRVSLDSSGNPTSVTIIAPTGPLTLDCTRILISAGPWTPRVLRALFSQCKIYLPISPYAGHSLLIRSPRWRAGDESSTANSKGAGACALFASDARSFNCEMFARSTGELYLAGVNSRNISLPERPTDRLLDEPSLARLRRIAEQLCGLKVRSLEADGTGSDDTLEVLREGLCFRPITPLGRPIIDKVDVAGDGRGPSKVARHGVWVAAGHGPWGITLSLGTGKVVAELLQGKEPSASVRACRLREFANAY